MAKKLASQLVSNNSTKLGVYSHGTIFFYCSIMVLMGQYNTSNIFKIRKQPSSKKLIKHNISVKHHNVLDKHNEIL